MEELTLCFCSSLMITCLIFLYFLPKLIASQPKSPPGPKPWPIIGNLNLLGACPHRSLHALSKTYGEIMQLKFGSKPVIVASSPEAAKEFLKTHDQKFLSRPVTAAGRHLNYDCTNLSWSSYGPYWRQARKSYMNELLSTKPLDSYEYIRIEEMKYFLSKIYALVGKPIVLKEHFISYTMTNITRTAFGENYCPEYNSKVSEIMNIKEFRETLEEWFALNGVFVIGDYIPWLGFLDLQGYVKRMKISSKKVDKFNSFVVNDHRAKRELAGDNFKPKDFVDILIQLADDSSTDVKLTTNNIKALLQDIMVGGTDTTALTVEWAMSELLKHPNILERATEEVDRVIGKERWVEERDSSKLPFLDAIVKETMRLHPVVTLLVPRLSLEDCNVSGYHIPKGTTLLVNVWSIGRDPRYWDNPEEFQPERFLGKDIDMKGQHFELLPFGSGRRICPGYNLGIRILRSTLANLVHGFRWKLPHNVKPEDIDMEEEYGLTTHRKNPIVAIAEPRLQAFMYHVGSAKPSDESASG